MTARFPFLLGLLLAAIGACGDGGDSGGAAGNACEPTELPDGASCGSSDACCSGFCANARCTAENVAWTASCAPAPCGGNPEGVWTLASGCADSSTHALDTCADPGKGAVAADGSLTVAAGGAETTTYGYSIRACGFTSKGGGHALSGDWDGTAQTVGGLPYCVSGDSLYLFAGTSGLGPHVTAIVLKR
ncbi:MAG: hypothetical protein L6Q84_33880 [Polyangiaceae bacterium]|nr:hypothetical protein [Polyangiaceae bacterium]